MIGLFIVLEALYRSFGRVIGDWYGLEYWGYDWNCFCHCITVGVLDIMEYDNLASIFSSDDDLRSMGPSKNAKLQPKTEKWVCVLPQAPCAPHQICNHTKSGLKLYLN
jgi:hypothetical protein